MVRDKQDQRFALKIVKEYGRNPIIKELTNREVKVQSQFKGDPHIIQIIAFKYPSKDVEFSLRECSSYANLEPAHCETSWLWRVISNSRNS